MIITPTFIVSKAEFSLFFINPICNYCFLELLRGPKNSTFLSYLISEAIEKITKDVRGGELKWHLYAGKMHLSISEKWVFPIPRCGEATEQLTWGKLWVTWEEKFIFALSDKVERDKIYSAQKFWWICSTTMKLDQWPCISLLRVP